MLHVGKFPKGAICAVTTSWDDNDQTNLRIDELLRSMNLKGTFFIDPGKQNGLSDNQLRKLVEQNEIGSHTWSHRNLKRCTVGEIVEELTRSKSYLEQVTKREVVGLAYPWGEYTRQCANIAKEIGYMFARTVGEGQINFPPSNPFAWGVSIHAMNKPRLLSRRATLYIRYLSNNWVQVARKLFFQASKRGAVWHLFGHAWEVFEHQGLLEDLLTICKFVSNRKNVWYATNGDLFQNESVRRNTSITSSYDGGKMVFSVETRGFLRPIIIPLRFSLPEGWGEKFLLNVTTSNSGKYETGLGRNRGWIDVLDIGAKITFSRT